MKVKLTALSLVAALGFAACTTTNTNTSNANSNRAVVVNSNQAPVTNMNMNSTMNMNSGMNGNSNATRSNINYNGTAKENEAQRTSVESEAKGLGRTIGTGANDWWLWGKTRAALTAENDLRDSTVSVDVDNAVVTLTGTVANQEQVKKADAVVKKIEGVTRVVNKLQVNPNASVTGGSTNSNANSKK